MGVNQPELSVNKLAEYIVSKGARQRKLLRDRKYPDPEFQMGMFHREASEAVRRYIADGCVDAVPIENQIAILKQQSPDKIGTIRRVNANIDALERFLDMLDDLGIEGEPELASHTAEKITIHGVRISVRPEIIVRGTGPKGKKLVGAIKLHFSKSFQMTAEAAGYVSAVVQQFCKDHLLAPDEVLFSDYCKVIDIGSGNVFPGVKATTARMKDVSAECENIAGLWPTI
ncbi:hypothetical protein [uncultured Sphingomonas sp.]|uniref:hypothetical protein n=1 Tax=uncultured Sphingomonas sp. TaxID=158754 RepID=UPI0025DACA4C|nr:hypothetical protein [uncultured Sphingomonas sp.]